MMKKIILTSIAIVLLISASTIAWASPKHLHLTWQNDPRYSIVISWRTDSEEPSWVQYGKSLPYSDNATAPPGKLHHVELVDLQPGTTYHYRCGSELGWSDDFTFKTAPSNPSESFRFVALGDSRTNWDIWGDCSEAVEIANPGFVLHTGDVVAHGSDQAEWNVWFDEAADLLRETVFMPAMGNHDENAPNYYRQFTLPHNEDWYSFDYGNAHFIALSTEKPMGGVQRDWLERDLSSTNATWIFVFYHRPMYSSGSHGPERSVYNAWGDLFDKYHVDMVFNGHDHCYERTHPMADDWLADAPENGTIHIVTGGAGAPLYGMAAEGPWSAKFMSVNHFLVLEIDGTELNLEARYFNQTVFDEVTVSKAILPDLAIRSTSTTPKYPVPGKTCKIEFEVGNSGSQSSQKTSVAVKVDGRILGELDIESLEPGEISLLSLDWDSIAEGHHDIEIVVDENDRVFEGLGEANNEKLFGVRASPPKPDLAFEEITSDSMLPEIGETVTFALEVVNEGTDESGPFELVVNLSNEQVMTVGTTFNLTSGLAQGDSMEVYLPWVCASGDWDLVAVVDPKKEVEEISEENNVASDTFYYRDFMKVGPAHLPQGFGINEQVVIYYNQSEGKIPRNSTTCTLVWGINGWKRPPSDLAPPGTVRRKAFETEMVEVSDGLWLASIPSDDRFQWIDLKFEDRQFLPKYLDDNDGENWIIPGESWAYGRMDDLIAVMDEAEESGVDVSPYRDLLQEANQHLEDGRYLDAAMILINATEQCKMTECEVILDNAKAEYQLALDDGLEVDRVNSFLIAAQAQLDAGNFRGSKQFSETSLLWIYEAREKVPQRVAVPALLLLAALGFVVSREKGLPLGNIDNWKAPTNPRR